MANCSFRLDEELKKQAEELFEELGMNFSTALNIFVKQAVREQKIPFEVAAEVSKSGAQKNDDIRNANIGDTNVKKLHISMVYNFCGDTCINIPIDLLEGKTEEEQYAIAYNYAKEHIRDIPVANNARYVPDSDQFDIEDIEFKI